MDDHNEDKEILRRFKAALESRSIDLIDELGPKVTKIQNDKKHPTKIKCPKCGKNSWNNESTKIMRIKCTNCGYIGYL